MRNAHTFIDTLIRETSQKADLRRFEAKLRSQPVGLAPAQRPNGERPRRRDADRRSVYNRPYVLRHTHSNDPPPACPAVANMLTANACADWSSFSGWRFSACVA